MQLAVIDDLIEQQKAIIRKYPDNKDKVIAYLSGFIDCARKAQVISEKRISGVQSASVGADTMINAPTAKRLLEIKQSAKHCHLGV